MSYQLKHITDKEEWEGFITSHPEANFLQSWNYANCYKNLGNKIFTIAIYKKNKLHAAAFILKEKAKRGTYLSIAGGPILDYTDQPLFNYLTKQLRQLAKQEKALFIRIRPNTINNQTIQKCLKTSGWIPSPVNLEAELTLMIDLTKTQDQLIKEMKKNTRYEIRRAPKFNITTTVSTRLTDLEQFCNLQEELGKKQGFTPFSTKLLIQQFKELSKDNQVALINAYQDKTLLASAYIIFYNQKAAYHYGISTHANHRLPGSYAVQQRVIEEAQKRGIKQYNLWGGLVPEGFEGEHRYKGVDHFKRGFGGEEIRFTPAHDLVVSPLYYLTKYFELFRKKRRGL